MKFILQFLTAYAFAMPSATAESIRLPQFNQREPAFVFMNRVVLEALRRTEDSKNPDKISYHSEYMTQDRAIQCLRDQIYIDLFYTMTSAEREKGLLVVRYPLLKGLLGYRGFLANSVGAQKIRSAQSVEDFKKRVHIIQGADWPDFAVLERNGFQVSSAMNYNNGALYYHVLDNRFDAVALGVFELQTELNKFKLQKKLELIDQTILQYQAPVFLFLPKEKPELARRLERGLQSMKSDGTFDRWFLQEFRSSVKIITSPKTKIFGIENSSLTLETQKALRLHCDWSLKGC